MEDNERNEHLAYFRLQHLPFALMALANQLELMSKSFNEFKKMTRQISKLSVFCLYRDRGIKSVMADQELWDKLMFLVVGSFNSVLPLDYPYVLALIEYGDDPRRCDPRAMVRSAIPGWRDWVSNGCVPKFTGIRAKNYRSEQLRYEKTFLPDGKGGFVDPSLDPEGLEPK